MLEVFFCNVGDGDAVLLTDHTDDRPDYRVLVDTGRPFVEPAEGSRRRDVLYYLKEQGIDSIDRMILTHLHIDHIGGAMRILECVSVKRLESLFIPPKDAEWIALPDTTEKPLNGFCYALNIFTGIVRKAESLGCRMETAGSGTVRLTENLSMTTYLPRADVIDRHLSVAGALLSGHRPEHDLWYRASKERNLTSLMHRFSYGGGSVLLTGDRYASDWENEGIGPCDILKLPHHGDPQSMTDRLISQLRPAYAVISCQNSPEARKDRPNADILRLLRETVPNVLCTENREMPGFSAGTTNGIRFRISDTGTIACIAE